MDLVTVQNCTTGCYVESSGDCSVLNEKFDFLDFEPDSDVKSLSSQILSELLGHAPSDATSTARIVRKGDGFEATVKLCSLAGTFGAQVAARNPIAALEALCDRVLEQIGDWRRHRFHRESLASLPA